MIETRDVITIIIAVLGSGGLWSFIQYRLQQRDLKKMQENSADTVERRALLAILHDRIYSSAPDIIERGYVTVDELDNLKYLYRPYKALGGNGTGEKLVSDVKNLPIKKEREKHD